jgi:hypothetical protein
VTSTVRKGHATGHDLTLAFSSKAADTGHADMTEVTPVGTVTFTDALTHAQNLRTARRRLRVLFIRALMVSEGHIKVKLKGETNHGTIQDLSLCVPAR